MGEHGKREFLDVDVYEVARSVHRVVRAMHDGECPKCHGLFNSSNMQDAAKRHFSRTNQQVSHMCPRCGFYITNEEAQAAIAEFGPVMDLNLETFEEWRKNLK